MSLPPAAAIYEINTWVWLNTLSAQTGQTITLENVPDSELDRIARLCVAAVWLMGVWYRSPAGRNSALNYLHEYRGALPDIEEQDVVGSAYAIGDYQVDERLGGASGLAHLRERLRSKGIRLILDFVPNHVALDHPWIQQEPQLFVRGDAESAAAQPDRFAAVHDRHGQHYFVAHGRDPYFPSWVDTAQLNAFAPEYRAAAEETLAHIARQCDGVRCDMAMLLLNDVFANTWGQQIPQPRPRDEFWPPLIQAIRREHPDFTFLAEVYWDLEKTLLSQGFDLCYHKNLYDRIMQWDYDGLRALLQMRPSNQIRLLNFLENHDEPRVMERLGRARQMAAATLIATIPSAILLHDGQLAGRRIKLPVQISRQPDELLDPELYAFYERLLRERSHEVYRQGEWQLLPITHPLCCFSWQYGEDWRLIAVNFSDQPVDQLVSVPILGDARVTDPLALKVRCKQVNGGILALSLAPYGVEIWKPLNERD